MKKFLICIFFFMAIVLLPLKANALDYKQEIDNIAEQNNISKEDIYNITPASVVEYIKEELSNQFSVPVQSSLKLVAIIILCALVKSVEPDGKDSVTVVTDSICTLTIFLSLLTPLQNMLQTVSENLFQIKNFMISFIPIYSGISLASGEIITSTIYNGFFLSALIFISDFCTKAILPSLQMYFALVISNALSPFIKLKALCDFYLKSVKWILKSTVSVICFILTLQTTISRTSENLAIKTGKAIVGTAVPVIGSALQDAVSSVYAGMESIKGFAGVVGILSVLNIFMPSVIMLVIYWFITNILFIMTDMFDLKAAGNCINGLSYATEIMISIIILFLILFIFSLAIMISITKGV